MLRSARTTACFDCQLTAVIHEETTALSSCFRPSLNLTIIPDTLIILFWSSRYHLAIQIWSSPQRASIRTSTACSSLCSTPHSLPFDIIRLRPGPHVCSFCSSSDVKKLISTVYTSRNDAWFDVFLLRLACLDEGMRCWCSVCFCLCGSNPDSPLWMCWCGCWCFDGALFYALGLVSAALTRYFFLSRNVGNMCYANSSFRI